MKWFGRRQPLCPRSVVVPVYAVRGVAASTPACAPWWPRRTPGGRRWSSTTAPPTGPARSPTSGRAREPRIRVVHTANGGLGAARNVGAAARARRLPRLPRLRRRAAAHGADADLVGVARGLGLGLRHRVDAALGGRRADRAAVDAPAAPPAAGRRAGRTTTPRSSATSSRGTSCSGGPSGTRPGLTWPERVRYEDQPTTTRAFLDGHLRRARRGRLPLADPHRRHLDHPDQRGVGAGPGRPLGDQADDAGVRAWSTATPRSTAYFVDRVLRRRPVALLPAGPGCRRRVVAAAARRRARAVGPALAGAQRAAAGAPALPAGWSSRTAAPTPPR